jgi:hypothetical protein
VTLRSERARVLRAFVYLRTTSMVNAAWLRLKRLRQPKYLFGALLMAGYLALMFSGPLRGARQLMPMTPQLMSLSAGIGALGLFVVVAAVWLLPGNRAALAFSEAEIAFLFPAPLTRVALINFSLLRSQMAIFLSAFLLSVVFGRGRGLPGNAWQHATGVWLLMATLRLHFLGASFAHERLFQAGWHPWLRRIAGSLLLLGVFGGLMAWMASHVRPPGIADLADARALGHWLGPVLDAPPANVVLAPFRWLLAPLFAGGDAHWWVTLLPALGLLALHYAWVVRSHVAFEEASIDRARRSAERVQALRAGRFRGAATTARAPAFALAPRGFAPVAFLWQGLLAAGAAGRPRNWLWLGLGLATLVVGLAQTPWRTVVVAIGGLLLGLATWAPLMGPMIWQRTLRDTLDLLDIYKAAPVPGWQVALGQLLTPVLLITAGQWLMGLLGLLALTASGQAPWAAGASAWAGVFGVLLLTPPLCMLLLCVPFAGVLWFPAWAAAFSARGGGFEVAGQRLAFGALFLLATLLALLPAGLLGGGAYLLGRLLDWPVAGLLLGILAAAALLLAETAGALRLLGRRIDRFDLSQESR